LRSQAEIEGAYRYYKSEFERYLQWDQLTPEEKTDHIFIVGTGLRLSIIEWVLGKTDRLPMIPGREPKEKNLDMDVWGEIFK
jgi:hypothetical protein